MNLPEHFRATDGHLSGARCLFVIGAPRSGTTWLQRMIEAHHSVASIPQELTVFSRYLAPVVEGYQRELDAKQQGRWQQGLPMIWSDEEFYAYVRRALDEVYGVVLKRNPGADLLIDKHPGYCHHLELIDRFLPGSRFIHIIRDGREVAVSMLSARQRLGFGADSIQGCAAEWATSVLDSQGFRNRLGSERYLEIRYDRLLVSPESELQRVFDFCGLKSDDSLTRTIAEENHISRMAVSKGDPEMRRLREMNGQSWSTKLSLRQRFWFDRIAGGLLMELGYAQPGWWVLSPWDRLRMALFPIRVKAIDSMYTLMRIWTAPFARRLGGDVTRGNTLHSQ